MYSIIKRNQWSYLKREIELMFFGNLLDAAIKQHYSRPRASECYWYSELDVDGILSGYMKIII